MFKPLSRRQARLPVARARARRPQGRRPANTGVRRLAIEALEQRRLLAVLAAPGEIIFQEDFESGNDGWITENTGGEFLGLWHYSAGRRDDGLPNHSPDYNSYYGQYETSTGGGHFRLPGPHQGTLTSPEIDLTDVTGAELQFSYVLATRDGFDRDIADVYVIDDAGQTLKLSRTKADSPEVTALEQTGNGWLTATSDLSEFAGTVIRLQFFFDTVTTVSPFDPYEGWYIDDVAVATSAAVDIQISKSESVDPVVAGSGPGNLVYTVTAANLGPSDASDVTVSEVLTLVPGVTIDSIEPSAGAISGTSPNFVWELETLAAGASETLTVTLTVGAAAAAGTDVIGDTATLISVNEPGTDPQNDSASESTSIAKVEVTPVVQFITPLSVFRAEEGDDGGFQYSAFKRPADTPEDDPDHPFLGNWTTHTDEATLLAALEDWQRVTVTNETAADFNITDVTTDAVGNGADYVDVTDEDLQPLVFPIVVPAGGKVTLWVFYSPEEPDWSVAPGRPAHTFARGDHLKIATDFDGGRVFDVALVGASTYDADITYDGVIDGSDAVLLNNILATDEHWPVVPGEPGWDPTADINVKFRNGAEASPDPPGGADQWPEIGLGDLGPLNAEFDALRPPFVDLDADNSSEVRGVDFSAQHQVGGDPIEVADTDARFENSPFLFLGSVTVAITNLQEGDVLAADTSVLGDPNDPFHAHLRAPYDAQSGILTLEADPGAPSGSPRPAVADFEKVLRTVNYSSSLDSPDLTPRVIEVQAIGIGTNADELAEQQAGNVAVSTVMLEAAAAAAEPVAAVSGLSTAPASLPDGSGVPELLSSHLSADPIAEPSHPESESAAAPNEAATPAVTALPAVTAVAADAATTEAVSAIAVDAVMDTSPFPPEDAPPADPDLPDDLLRSLALYWLEDAEEEEQIDWIDTPETDPGVLLN